MPRAPRRVPAAFLVPALVLAPILTPAPSRASTATVLRKAAISAGLVGAAFALDGVIEPGDEDRIPGEVIEVPGEVAGAGSFVFGGTAVLAAAGLITGNAEALHTAKDLAIALTATSGAVWFLKYTTQRARPDGSNHYSFPSGHTAVAFAAASVIDKRYGGIAGWGAYAAAALAGEARVADNHHYLSDVVAGAVLGTVIGHLVTRAP
jgi:membrane-associated phospholipid phosphatase